MTVSDAQAAKERAESEICKILVKFVEETGLDIQYIDAYAFKTNATDVKVRITSKI
jgi:hypothetical protein